MIANLGIFEDHAEPESTQEMKPSALQANEGVRLKIGLQISSWILFSEICVRVCLAEKRAFVAVFSSLLEAVENDRPEIMKHICILKGLSRLPFRT